LEVPSPLNGVVFNDRKNFLKVLKTGVYNIEFKVDIELESSDNDGVEVTLFLFRNGSPIGAKTEVELKNGNKDDVELTTVVAVPNLVWLHTGDVLQIVPTDVDNGDVKYSNVILKVVQIA
jgi:translation initiation factor IF-1